MTKNFLLILLIFKYRDCQNNCYQLINNSKCNCSIDYTNTNLIITCSDFISNDEIKLPNITANKVKVVSGLTKWPHIPENFINTARLDFSFNRIVSIGDLSNCHNLRTLNCSHNRLIDIPNSLIKVKNLISLDLSFNLIEYLNMELFMTSVSNFEILYFWSELRYLDLSWNRIKIVANMDSFIFGMPFLIQFDLSNNQIIQINITNISQNSEKISQLIKKKYETGVLVEFVYATCNFIYNQLDNYFLFLNNNQIEYFEFGFKEIYQTFMKINGFISDDYLYVRFTSILLGSERINCSCGLFEDFNFLINGPLNESQYFESLNKSLLASTQCKANNNESINIISDLTSGKSQFWGTCIQNSAARFLNFNLNLIYVIFMFHFFLIFINIL